MHRHRRKSINDDIFITKIPKRLWFCDNPKIKKLNGQQIAANFFCFVLDRVSWWSRDILLSNFDIIYRFSFVAFVWFRFKTEFVLIFFYFYISFSSIFSLLLLQFFLFKTKICFIFLSLLPIFCPIFLRKTSFSSNWFPVQDKHASLFVSLSEQLIKAYCDWKQGAFFYCPMRDE